MRNFFKSRFSAFGALAALALFSVSAEAAECPWRTGRDLSIWFEPDSVEQISKRQAEEDLDCFIKALKLSYSALHDQNEKLMLEKLEMISASLPETVRTEDLGKRILEDVAAHVTDVHFQIRVKEDHFLRSQAKKILIAQRPVRGASSDLSCKGAQLRKVWIQDQLEERWVLRHEKPLTQLSCLNRKTNTRLSLALSLVLPKKLDFDPAVPMFKKEGKVIFFRPGSLMGNAGLGPELEQKRFLELIQNEDRPLILDLRGNRGGGGTFASDLAELLSTPDQRIPSSKSVSRKGAFPELGFINTLYLLKYPSAAEYREKFEGYFGATSVTENLARQDRKPELHRYKGRRLKEYQSPITVLTDQQCASECETIVELLMWHPKVRFLGTPTAGALHFSNAAGFLLPNSSLIAYIPTLRHDYEADAAEAEGYEPNFYYFEGDPVAKAMESLQEP